MSLYEYVIKIKKLNSLCYISFFLLAAMIFLSSLGRADEGGIIFLDDFELSLAEFGLETRPENSTCVAPNRPPNSTGISFERAFSRIRFSSGTVLLQPPNDSTRWLLAERSGRIIGFANDDTTNVIDEVLNIGSQVSTSQNGGLLGMAFHPDYPTDGRLFLFYTNPVANSGQDVINTLSSFTSSDGGQTFDMASEQIVFSHETDNGIHPGGHIGFGPEGYLYLATGDGFTKKTDAQDTTNVKGSILRLDVDSAQPYAIPSDNPFASGGGQSEIYAWGFRHPWRWNFDMLTGRLFLGDVGNKDWEEINLIVNGGNYGWPFREGSQCTGEGIGEEPCLDPSFIDPIVEYPHGDGSSAVLAGYVYRGTAIPDLQGVYLYADIIQGTVWGLAFDQQGNPETPTVLIDSIGPNNRHFAQANDGELYVLQGITIQRFIPASSNQADTFPQLLSETGCVDPQDPIQIASGLIPYELNVPFWSDGTSKQRWFALPNTTPDSTIQVDQAGDFEFPVGTVIVKSFKLNDKLIETRLLVHHDDGDWAGYSYEWNANETDANLVEPAGKNKMIDGQLYTYPSRAQCLQCHTQVAGRTLGPETLQLNRLLTYPSTDFTANQLATYDHIGLFNEPLSVSPSELAALPKTDDDSILIAERARAYLHSNCSQCHRPGGSGVGSIDFRFTTADEDIGVCNQPPSQGDLGVDGARLLVPGDPSKSIIALRMNRRGVDQMPPIGSNVIDTNGVALVEAWIQSLSECP